MPDVVLDWRRPGRPLSGSPTAADLEDFASYADCRPPEAALAKCSGVHLPIMAGSQRGARFVGEAGVIATLLARLSRVPISGETPARALYVAIGSSMAETIARARSSMMPSTKRTNKMEDRDADCHSLRASIARRIF